MPYINPGRTTNFNEDLLWNLCIACQYGNSIFERKLQLVLVKDSTICVNPISIP